MKSKFFSSIRSQTAKRTFFFWCISFLFILLIAFVADAFSSPLVKYDAAKGEYRRRDEARVFIVGKIVNIAHELQHRPGGADAQGALYSKGRQGLKTSGGRIWTFVDNIKGQQLQWEKAFLGRYVKIQCWVFHDAQYIEVDSFTVEGQEFIWNKTAGSFEPKADDTAKTEMKGSSRE